MNVTKPAAGEQSEYDTDDIESKIADLPADEASNRLRRRLLLARFWRSARGFWAPHGDRRAWLLTGTILLTVLLYLAASYGMNVWNRAIFDALERRDGGTVLYLSLIYIPLLVASVAVMLLQVYARMTAQRRWRAWLNNHLLDRWLKNMDVIISLIWSAATTRTRNIASPTMFGSQSNPPWSSPPGC